MLFAPGPWCKHLFERNPTAVGPPLEDVVAGSGLRRYVRPDGEAEGNAMLTVRNDWIEYETDAVPARRVAVRGGAACAQRVPAARPSVLGVGPAAPAARPPVMRATGPRPAVAGPARPAAPESRLRLTRRGRVVLVVLPSLLALSGLLLATAPGTAEAAQPAVSRSVVVGTGDTLWSIAERVAPETDPRDTVAALQQANGLTSAAIEAGTVLVLPSQH
jgi:hypothetical protein